MTTCPACSGAVAPDAPRCACGVDLAEARAERDRLLRPSALWAGDVPVVPIAGLARLPRETRRALIRAMTQAWRR